MTGRVEGAYWHAVPPMPIVLRGYGGSVTMTITDFLAPDPGDCASALKLNVDVQVGLRKPIGICTGYDGRLHELRRQLAVLTRTGAGSVQFEPEHLSWTIEPSARGSGDELLLTGVAGSEPYPLLQKKRLSNQKTILRDDLPN